MSNSNDDDVVDRADALMRRRRFVAIAGRRAEPQPAPSPAPSPHAPTPTPLEDDLPVLTEVVVDDDLPVLTDALPDATDDSSQLATEDEREALITVLTQRLSSQLSSELGSELAQAVERRLAAELPTLIEAVLLDVGTQLRAGITASVSDACRDFVRRHASPTER